MAALINPSHNLNMVWDVGTLSWVAETQPTGGGGGAVTIADGANVVEGVTSDSAVQGDNSGTISAKLRGLNIAVADSTTGPTTFSNGSGGPITIATPGGGTVILRIRGTATGNIGVTELRTPGGVAVNPTYTLWGNLNNPVANFQTNTSANINAGTSTDFSVLIKTSGVSITLTNSISTGSVTIEAVFKRGVMSLLQTVIVGNASGAGAGFGAEVSNANKLLVSMVGPTDVVGQVNFSTTDGLSFANKAAPLVANVPLNWNGATYDRATGDTVNGTHVGQRHAPNYIGTYASKVFSGGMGLTAINANTFTTAVLGATCTPITGIWNPNSSVINAVIRRATLSAILTALQNTSGAPYVWAMSTGNTSGSPAGNAAFNRKTLAASGATCKDVSGVALTNLTTNLVVRFGSCLGGGSIYNAAELGTAAGFESWHQGSVEVFDGDLIVPPGGVLALLADGGTPVAHSVVSSIVWEEVAV